MVHTIWRWLGCALLLAGIGGVLGGCGGQAPQSPSNAKLKAVVTVYPVYEFVRQVGGDKVEITMLLKPGAEPHDWEPTPQELAKIKNSKLFFYHGAGLEPVDKLLNKDVLGTAKAVEVSQGVALIGGDDAENHGHEAAASAQEAAGKHDHERKYDVHTWLDPLNAQQEVKNIAGALIEADPKNADYYRETAGAYCRELERLDKEYRQALATVNRREIITSHAAFKYLTNRYQLQQVAIMGLSPDSEPTAEKMAAVVNFCKNNQVRYIFFETLVSPKLANTIAKETGASLLVLNPLENLTQEEFSKGKNYISIMQDNLANLRIALQ